MHVCMLENFEKKISLSQSSIIDKEILLIDVIYRLILLIYEEECDGPGYRCNLPSHSYLKGG